jgi:ParB-like chromosome segregation protein Spo0J
MAKILKTEVLKIADLKLNDRNPRKNDNAVPNVVKSIEAFGFNNPILIDKDNVIIAGHTRVKAAAKLEMQEVPCIRLEHLNKKQAQAYMIADNKLNELAEWDNQLLKDILNDLPETLDVEAMGFDLDEIEDLIADFKPNLPDENEELEHKTDYSIHVMCQDEETQQELFIELRDRGFVVK